MLATLPTKIIQLKLKSISARIAPTISIKFYKKDLHRFVKNFLHRLNKILNQVAIWTEFHPQLSRSTLIVPNVPIIFALQKFLAEDTEFIIKYLQIRVSCLSRSYVE